MKKVGLVSVRNHNYGSLLQAYALQCKLCQAGIDNEIIQYNKSVSFKQVLRVFNLPLLKSKIKSVIRNSAYRSDMTGGEILKARDEKFKSFIETHLILSEPYNGRTALENGVNNYASFILGSDQVWNPMNFGSDFYTLSWIPKDMLKVTYSPSFGVSSIPTYQKEKTKEYLSRIQNLSTREVGGKKIVKDLLNIDIPVVVDPTLLFNRKEWCELIPESIPLEEKYIFAYFVGNNEEHRNAVAEIGNKTGYRVILLPHVDEYVKTDVKFYNATLPAIGPTEFVNLIRHAAVVCTDSFHATIFSIQYHKQFMVFDRYRASDKANMNGRLTSILGKLGLQNRLVSSRDNYLDWYDEQIDYVAADEKLINFKKESEQYFKDIAMKLKESQVGR